MADPAPPGAFADQRKQGTFYLGREYDLAARSVLDAQIEYEAKDLTTRGHLDRTQDYGLALARKIAPELADSPELGYGFFLHDIGKVGIPEHILCKPGPLSRDEWDIMKSHPTIGAQIVAPIRFLGRAVRSEERRVGKECRL